MSNSVDPLLFAAGLLFMAVVVMGLIKLLTRYSYVHEVSFVFTEQSDYNLTCVTQPNGVTQQQCLLDARNVFWQLLVLGLPVVWFGSQIVAYWFGKLFPNLGSGFNLHIHNTWQLWVAVLLLVPIAEELIFRKALFMLFFTKSRSGFWAYVLISASVFALLHKNPQLILLTFFMGFYLAILYVAAYVAGFSAWAVVFTTVAHAVFNLSSMLLHPPTNVFMVAIMIFLFVACLVIYPVLVMGLIINPYSTLPV